MKIEFAFVLFVLEATVLGSPLKHVYKRNMPFPPRDDRTRIVGGVEVTPHAIPYQVALVVNSMFFCGGVLISTKYVLTVAHCTYQMKDIAVILGAHDIRYSEDTQQVLYSSRIISHENYTSTSFENDISLIKLPCAVAPTAAISAIHYLAPKTSSDFVGQRGRISGWGFTSSSSQVVQSKLRKAFVEIISNKRCVFISKREAIPYSELCTLGIDDLVGAVGACDGDSGGPLVVGNELVGLVSSGFRPCEAGLPTMYTRISYFREWISSHSGV